MVQVGRRALGGLIGVAVSCSLLAGGVAAHADDADPLDPTTILPVPTVGPSATASPSAPTGTPGSTPSPSPSPSPSPTSSASPTRPAYYLDPDGRRREAAPLVVSMADGAEFFIGPDFDSACYDGKAFRSALRALGRVARMIEQSGRTAVVAIAPNKSSVETGVIAAERGIPHGDCARNGLRRQQRLLDRWDDPRFVALRKPLADDRRQVYWRYDSHWNYIGATVFAKAVTQHLDAKVAGRLRFAPTTDQRATDLNIYSGRRGTDAVEVNKGLVPAGGVRAQAAPGQVEIDSELPTTTRYRWHSTPARKTIRGRTTVIGDSFGYLSLRSLRPSFANGDFVWSGYNSDDDMIDSIVASNTVVIEVAQRLVTRTQVGRPRFVASLAEALAEHPVRRGGGPRG